MCLSASFAPFKLHRTVGDQEDATTAALAFSCPLHSGFFSLALPLSMSHSLTLWPFFVNESLSLTPCVFVCASKLQQPLNANTHTQRIFSPIQLLDHPDELSHLVPYYPSQSPSIHLIYLDRSTIKQANLVFRFNNLYKHPWTISSS